MWEYRWREDLENERARLSGAKGGGELLRLLLCNDVSERSLAVVTAGEVLLATLLESFLEARVEVKRVLVRESRLDPFLFEG